MKASSQRVRGGVSRMYWAQTWLAICRGEALEERVSLDVLCGLERWVEIEDCEVVSLGVLLEVVEAEGLEDGLAGVLEDEAGLRAMIAVSTMRGQSAGMKMERRWICEKVDLLINLSLSKSKLDNGASFKAAS